MISVAGFVRDRELNPALRVPQKEFLDFEQAPSKYAASIFLAASAEELGSLRLFFPRFLSSPAFQSFVKKSVHGFRIAN